MRPQDLYRRQQRETATPQTEIVTVFQELVQTVADAKQAIADGRLESANVRFIAAQRVLVGLRMGLAPEPREVVANLSALYSHCEALLARANMQKSMDDSDAALGVLTSLRDTWRDASDLLNGSAAGDAQAVLK